MEKFLSHTMAILIELVLYSFIFMLLAHIIVDVAVLFQVSPISELSYINLLGFILILRLATIKGPPNKDVKKSLKEKDAPDLSLMLKMMFVKLFVTTTLLLGMWLTSYILYWIAI